MREKIERVEIPLSTLAERLNTTGNTELSRLLDEALGALEELKEHERLLSEIF